MQGVMEPPRSRVQQGIPITNGDQGVKASGLRLAETQRFRAKSRSV